MKKIFKYGGIIILFIFFSVSTFNGFINRNEKYEDILKTKLDKFATPEILLNTFGWPSDGDIITKIKLDNKTLTKIKSKMEKPTVTTEEKTKAVELIEERYNNSILKNMDNNYWKFDYISPDYGRGYEDVRDFKFYYINEDYVYIYEYYI